MHAAGSCLADGSENPAVQSTRETVTVGELVGKLVGELVGELVGDLDGALVIVSDDPLFATGLAEGVLVGDLVGALVGALVVGMGAGGLGEDPQPPTRILIGFLLRLVAIPGTAVARPITSARPSTSLTSIADARLSAAGT